MRVLKPSKCYAYDLLTIGALGIKGKFGSQASTTHLTGMSKLTLLPLVSQICLLVEVRKKLISLGPKKALLSNQTATSLWFLTQQGYIVPIKGIKRILNDS
jgi:hypothetical protein